MTLEQRIATLATRLDGEASLANIEYEIESFARTLAAAVREEALTFNGHIGTRWEVSAAGNFVTLVFDTLPNMENFLATLRDRALKERKI